MAIPPRHQSDDHKHAGAPVPRRTPTTTTTSSPVTEKKEPPRQPPGKGQQRNPGKRT